MIGHNTFDFPWCLQLRAGPMFPWVSYRVFRTIEAAGAAYTEHLRRGRGLLVRVIAR